ncbi:spore protease YyaC [Robertmurraya siralis]|uniref:spore protease YyaC n=1 Tax=Robertmurraya siralis TaxID=77777 RepID=UPI0010F923FE|nr:spore protease YyaC [Robertmurraya siralis]
MNDLKKLRNQLLDILSLHENKELVIVCVGSDRSTGDSLAPLVGKFLKEVNLKRFIVYGTLEDPIHAENLEEKMNSINVKHKDAYIIGIDACLGRLSSVGRIDVRNTPLQAGAGVGKNLPPVGESSIVGIVNISGFMEFYVLQSTRLSLVMSMANEIVELVKSVDEYLSEGVAEIKKAMEHKKKKYFYISKGRFRKWLGLV